MGSPPRSIDAGVAIGEIFLDKFRVDAFLGHGGMGVVALCTHLALNERVAIKMLRRDVLDDDEAVERFMREAQAASKLKSEYVARVTDVGRSRANVPYMVMEYLEGHDLDELLEQRGSLGIPWAVELTLQACEALAEAHSIGIVHRDVKPSNLFVTWRPDGSPLVKVLDFGISKALSSEAMGLTQTQSLLGTPAYMSPEQMRSARQVDGRTDIWSLGTVLYEMLEGRRPFEAESFSEMCVKVAVDPPGAMSSTPLQLQQVVLRCLAKLPEQRYASMAEVARDLAPFSQDPHHARVLVERATRMLRNSQVFGDASRSGARAAANPGLSNPALSNPLLPIGGVPSSGFSDPGFSSPGFSTGFSDPGFSSPGFSSGFSDPGFSSPGFSSGFSDPGFSSPGFSDPGFSSPGFSTGFSTGFSSPLSSVVVSNAALSGAELSNPALSNPALSNPALSNPALSNPALSNPALSNPALSNPALLNPALSNPARSNPALSMAGLAADASGVAAKPVLPSPAEAAAATVPVPPRRHIAPGSLSETFAIERPRRRRAILAVVAIGIAATVGVAASRMFGRSPERPAPPSAHVDEPAAPPPAPVASPVEAHVGAPPAVVPAVGSNATRTRDDTPDRRPVPGRPGRIGGKQRPDPARAAPAGAGSGDAKVTDCDPFADAHATTACPPTRPDPN